MSVAAVSDLPPVVPRRALNRFEIAFGVVLPIICITLDPYIVNVSKAAPLALWGIAGIGIFALLLSTRRLSYATNDLITGMLTGSAIAAGLIGIALLPLALMAIVMSFATLLGGGIGIIAVALLGFVPLLTAVAFYTRISELLSHAQTQSRNRNAFLIALGLLLVLGVPLASQIAEMYWFNRQFAALEGQDAETRLKAARMLDAYPLMQDRIKGQACELKTARENKGEPRNEELDMVIGPEGNFKCLQLHD